MVLKTEESVLEKKRKYYQEHKDKILERKHSRQVEIYSNKRAREASSEAEFEKEMMRKFSKQEAEKPEACEICGAKESDLGYPLERHHDSYLSDSYLSTDVTFLCKPCHGEADRLRRRK